MNGLIALGAGIAALTGIGGGIGIGIATGKATEASSGRRYCNFRLRRCTADHPVPGSVTEAQTNAEVGY